MIGKPNDWDNVQAATGEAAEKLPAGGYVCEIKGARMDKTQNGKEMFVVALDIAEGDYKGYFAKRHETVKKQNAYPKWPGVMNLFPTKSDGTTNPFYKGFFTCVEKSNQGYTWNWDERSLIGKKVGVLFREEEYLGQNGQKRTTTRANMARSAQKIRDGKFTIPEMRKLPAAQNTITAGFTEVVDDELPF